MTLRHATFGVIIGISYLFLVRLIATIAPGINASLAFSRINSLLMLLAALTPVFFYVAMLRKYIRTEQVLLRRVTLWALTGETTVAIMLLEGPVMAYQLRFFTGLFQSPLFEAVSSGITWIGAVLTLLFFLIFYRELRSGRPEQLTHAIAIAATGASVTVLLTSLLFLTYLVSGDLRWVSELPAGVRLGLLPVEALAFLAMLYFFVTFYRFPPVPRILDVA